MWDKRVNMRGRKCAPSSRSAGDEAGKWSDRQMLADDRRAVAVQVPSQVLAGDVNTRTCAGMSGWGLKPESWIMTRTPSASRSANGPVL